tara:strand:+ start:1281 stop:2318 length:1038 start_codon:yes stop_codon:yes gene_type:complete
MNETKKIKKQNINKKQLWNSFEKEFNQEENIECVYRNNNVGIFCECCESTLVINDEGYQCCTNNKCGIIYKDILDSTAEWRYYGADDNLMSNPTRAGPPINPLLIESSFGCKLICNNSSSYEMKKLKRYAEWQSTPYKEKSLYEEFQRISTLAGHSGIPKIIIDDAVRYHKKISEYKTFRGLNRNGILAASIYIACRLNNHPRSAKEIATIFKINNATATKGCKNANSIINELENECNTKTILCKTTPESFIERYCSKLNINKELTNLAMFISIRILEKNIIPENTPNSISAGIIYFITQECNLNVTKKQISNISEISEVTINKCYKKLIPYKNYLIPRVILNKY